MPQVSLQNAPAPQFGSFVDVFDTLFPEYLQDSRVGGTNDQTIMRVCQAGHEKVVPPNPDIVFRMVAGGKLTHSSVDCGNGRTALCGRSGSFYIAPPDAEAQWCSEGDHDLLMLSVPKERVYDLLDEDGSGAIADPLRDLYGRDLFDAMLAKCLEMIWQETTTQERGARLRVDGLFLTLLGTLARLADSGNSKGLGRSVPKLDHARLARVTDYIEAHLETDMGVQDLADVACLSLHHFTRAFAAATQVTPHKYVTIRRVTASKSMLAGRELTLSEIAYACGFSSQSHFTTTFKEHMGTTPGLYRKELAG